MTKKRRSHRLYAKGYINMLRRVLASDCTTDEVCAAIGRPRSNMLRQVMVQMRFLGLTHICRWERAAAKGKLVPVWRFGEGVDAPYQLVEGGFHPGFSKPKIGVEMLAFAAFIRELREGNVSSRHLAEMTGWILPTVGNNLRIARGGPLKDKPKKGFVKLVHVGSWIRRKGNGGAPTPLYSLGNLPDAPRPELIPSSVLSANTYAKRVALQAIHRMAGPLRQPEGMTA